MPKMTEAHLEARRKQILHGARECFIRKGFHQATMKDICEAADLSPGAVYHYFDSKESIVRALTERMIKKTGEIFAESLREGSGDEDPVWTIFNAFVRLLDDENFVHGRSLHMDLFSESTRNPAIADAMRRDIGAAIELATDLVAKLQAKGSFSKALDPEAVARSFYGLWLGLGMQLVLESEFNRNNYLDVCRAMLSGATMADRLPEISRTSLRAKEATMDSDRLSGFFLIDERDRG